MTTLQQSAQDIFRQHSVTYSGAARLFPKELQDRVALLYAFVRLADEYVDNPVEDPATKLGAFRATFDAQWQHNCQDTDVMPEALIAAFVHMAQAEHFEKAWIDAFFDSMEEDIAPKRYATWQELHVYIFGSAEVIGLMMSRLMGVDTQYDKYARALGTSMQLINFLRDVAEDHERDRLYIPQEALQTVGLQEKDLFLPGNIEKKTALVHRYLQEIDQYQQLAEIGIGHLPASCRLPVRLASKAYLHTLKKIRKKPLLVYAGVPKNTMLDVVWVAISSLFSAHGS